MDLSERNIIPTLDHYVELLAKQAEFDRLAFAGKPHDFAEFLVVVYDLPEIESALLAGGLYKWSADEALAWARRKP